MQRDPRQRGREGENCFSCYLLPATFQIITKQMPILESHLNKVWDWTIIEENTKEKQEAVKFPFHTIGKGTKRVSKEKKKALQKL